MNDFNDSTKKVIKKQFDDMFPSDDIPAYTPYKPSYVGSYGGGGGGGGGYYHPSIYEDEPLTADELDSIALTYIDRFEATPEIIYSTLNVETSEVLVRIIEKLLER